MQPIHLAEDTITREELLALSEWMLAGNRLTKGTVTVQFEQAFASYLGCAHAVYTNSGSSSNLLMYYALQEAGRLRNNIVIAPALSWVTTVSPLMQLGLDVRLCECDAQDLGLDLDHLERLCREQQPALVVVAHVLGHANKMREIQAICDRYGAILLEDSCEALGSELGGKKLGSLSTAGSFSFYYGHHISTIEGGMVVTDDTDLYHIMLSLRSHGWSRDLPDEIGRAWKDEHDVDDVRNLYTFYHPGFNLRSTDLQAFLGLSQLKKMPEIITTRQDNFAQYRDSLRDFFTQISETEVLSSFAYGTLVDNRTEVFNLLKHGSVESRPLICGNLGRHPFWIKAKGVCALPQADIVHEKGIYLPNHRNLSVDQVDLVCDLFKEVARPVEMRRP